MSIAAAKDLSSGSKRPGPRIAREQATINGLVRVVGVIAGFFALSVTAVTEASESNGFPLPFSGTYQSLASEARERTSWGKNSWVTIPQNVYRTLVKDEEIV